MIKHYRKKPVVIEALQWNGLNLQQVKKFCPVAIIEISDAGWRAGVTPPHY